MSFDLQMQFIQDNGVHFVVSKLVTDNLSQSIITALCGGEKYDILEDMGFSARNRRKQSLQSSEPRPSFDNSLLRRLSTESTDSQEEVRLVSSTSEPELQRTRSFSTEGCHLRTLSEKTTKVIKQQKSNSLDLDLSSFDFSELRSKSLSSTEC